jgi:hypothetical protein
MIAGMTAANHLESGEEQKMPDSNAFLSDFNTSRSNNIITTTTNCQSTSTSTSTDIVLESMEECVGCIEGINAQHTFEESLRKQAIHQRQIATEQGLSEAEAALIRLQMIDIDATTVTSVAVASSAVDGIRSAMENALSTNTISSQLDDILEQVCGVQDSTASGCYDGTCKITVAGGSSGISCGIMDNDPLPADLCEGIVLPMDTTLPTSLPGNYLVESKQGKITRSLVDVAAEDDQEEDLTIDVMDTTLPTSLPGNYLGGSKQGTITRSLVDVAAEDDVIQETDQEEDLTTDVMDTTLPTSLPGKYLGETKQGKIARSLVDVAAEDDALQETDKEEDLTIDVGAFHECAICNDSAVTCDINGDENTGPSKNSPLVGSTKSTSTMRKPVFCRLPCCEIGSNYDTESSHTRKHSNFNVCTACILVLTVATKDGANRVGRCPRCRQWISILTLHSTSASIEVRKLESTGKCEGCLKVTSPLIVEEPATCDACFLAGETSLTYECKECHQPQTIQSTLYRSQPSAKTFGKEMSPCNNCEKPTHWRILHDQLSFIPANDVPEEWGDDFLELARIRVQTARQGIAKLNLIGHNAQVQLANDTNCAVM